VAGFPRKDPPRRNGHFDQYEYRGLQVERYYHQESAAVGNQKNIAELEYNNKFVEGWLVGLLDKWQPDVAHFFHLKNLSASAIDLCRSRGVPMVLTATDFWLICPTTQLLLPDGSLCAGPDSSGVNCLRHAVENTQPKAVRRFFSLMRDSWVEGVIRASGIFPLDSLPPFSWAVALSRRADFIRQRAAMLDRILAPTEFMIKVLRSNGISPRRISLCRYGIDLTGYAKPRELCGSGERLRVGFIGSLTKPKGAHVLVEAFRRIPSDVAVDLMVYGDPKNVSRLFVPTTEQREYGLSYSILWDIPER
jgi:glycosyltransferase involved in cell wall biosynthesis